MAVAAIALLALLTFQAVVVAATESSSLAQAEQRHASLSKEQAMLFEELREINSAARRAATEPSPEHMLQVEQLSHDLSLCAGEAKKTHALQRRASGDLAACRGDLHRVKALAAASPSCPEVGPLGGYTYSEVGGVAAVICLIIFICGKFSPFSTNVSLKPLGAVVLGSQAVVIRKLVVGPSVEACTLQNNSAYDVDMTQCKLCAGSENGVTAVYEFDDGFLFARGTSVTIHAGRGARTIKAMELEDHHRFDSRRCSDLYWTTDSVWQVDPVATLKDSNGYKVHEKKIIID
jgi:hypothetical protein